MMKTMIASILSAGLALSTPAQAAPDTQAAIDGGLVRGQSDDGVTSWKGIPFAAPPVGPLRWRTPQPVIAWSGTRDATAYGHDCMQVPFPSDAAPLGTPPAEDCLYLNVWRPSGSARKLPVIVWIYGGGFVNGGASPPTYAGANMARQGVMFVSFNYRVGRFGTFAHPQLTRENADGGLLGNYGYMDQIAALKWVRRNVAAFGGDPANVTIVGESAGGRSVHALVTSPLARGLFQRAVVMSGGGSAALSRSTLSDVEAVGVAFAQSKGIAADDSQALAKLRAMSAEDVTSGLNMAAMPGPNGPRTYTYPFTDGKLSVDTGQAYTTGAFAHVPMMIGATSADIGGRTGYMVGGAREVSGMLAAQGIPVYEYRFSYVAEASRDSQRPGAGHASDIPFFFHNEAIKSGDKTTPRDVGVGRTISAYLVNFAKTGDPNGRGLPQWPRYVRSDDRIMDFAETGQAVPLKDPLGAEIDTAPSSPRS